MCDVAQVARLLERKWQLLRQVEEATQRMLDCPGEQLEELMWEREKLIKGLQKADAELEESCRDQEDGEQVLAAASGRWEEPPSGRLEEVGQAAQRLRTVLSRLRALGGARGPGWGGPRGGPSLQGLTFKTARPPYRRTDCFKQRN